LGAYADLTAVGVTAEELWEHRNSLLHMSNLDSRRVLAGRISRLMSYVGTLPAGFATKNREAKCYDLFALIRAVGAACSSWAESSNKDRRKFKQFLDRYDLIVSDNRLLRIEISAENA
jgi:hypothetical protein